MAPDQLAIYLIAGIFLVAGVLSFGVATVDPETVGNRYHPSVSLGAVLVGLLMVRAPWSRWHPRAKVVLPFLALLLAIIPTSGQGSGFAEMLAIIPLVFVLAGFVQPPGTSLLIAAPVVGILMAVHRTWTDIETGAALFIVPVAVLAGETVAQLVKRYNDAESRIARLTDAVRALARAGDERAGSELLGALAVELIGCDHVCVFTREPNSDRRLLQKGSFGHPALSELVELTVDLAPVRVLHSDSAVRFFSGSDSRHEHILAPNAARSVVTFVLVGDAGEIVGLVVGVWATRTWRLTEPARQAAELLSREGGRMLVRVQATERLSREADTDPLTQLANRRTFRRALDTLRSGDVIAVIDLDHFKSVNDAHGHDVGDQTLRQFSACLRRVARQVDTVARYGGEEFAIVLADAGWQGAEVVMRRLQEEWNSREPLTTFSAGVSVHCDGDDADDTLRRADRALYRAKHDGRDRVVYAPERVESLS